MTAAGGGADAEVDVEALYRAAALLRDAAPALGEAIVAASRALGKAGPAAGTTALSIALGELARRWDEAIGGTGRRIDESATMLHATVDAYVAADRDGAHDIGGPR